LEVMTAGVVLVGGIYLTEFVIPQWDNIHAFTSQVQGDGSWQDAFNRHRESYAAFNTRLFYFASSAPSPLISQRTVVDVLLTPLLDWRIPAVLVAVLLLLIWRETRTLAIAGAIVPLFVLFYSQGKTIGYTGYYLPEVILYFVVCLMLLMKSVVLSAQVLVTPRLRIQLVTVSAIAVAVFSLAAVPVTMGIKWRFGPYSDVFEVNRAAAFDIVGPHGGVAITSIPTWYIAGGSIVWQASTELTLANPESQANAQSGSTANREFPDIRELLRPFAAVVSDTEAWWVNWSKVAPLNAWYEERLLQMKGFVINMPYGSPGMVDLLYTAAEQKPLVKGFLIERTKVLRFSESEPSGSAAGDGDELWLTVLNCPTRPVAVDSRIRLMYSLPLKTEPNPTAPHLVLLGTKPEHFEEVVSIAGKGCVMRDMFYGRLTEINRQELKSRLKTNDRYIQIFNSRASALTAMDEEK
jgi:hypothetical protein